MNRTNEKTLGYGHLSKGKISKTLKTKVTGTLVYRVKYQTT